MSPVGERVLYRYQHVGFDIEHDPDRARPENKELVLAHWVQGWPGCGDSHVPVLEVPYVFVRRPQQAQIIGLVPARSLTMVVPSVGDRFAQSAQWSAERIRRGK